ncbi:hypothetical protein QAD02_021433 [Eretmocerus hayati]|uniref:Uncharacterized protein n=1 Tax=Eretmocerus hayati TaxID=131215 RepID=A0ACC2PQF2_9HYME|nr:hypothetical protein QAD02_021433 [Eretmocerus hayati]
MEYESGNLSQAEDPKNSQKSESLHFSESDVALIAAIGKDSSDKSSSLASSSYNSLESESSSMIGPNNYVTDVPKSEEVAPNQHILEDTTKGLPPHLIEMIHSLKNKMQGPYSPQIKELARSLHFHSPAAYRMVRGSFANCLPSIETPNRWYSLNDYSPGMSGNAIKNVSEMVSQESRKPSGKKLVFNITFDEIRIKKWAHMNKKSKKMEGIDRLGGSIRT